MKQLGVYKRQVAGSVLQRVCKTAQSRVYPGHLNEVARLMEGVTPCIPGFDWTTPNFSKHYIYNSVKRLACGWLIVQYWKTVSTWSLSTAAGAPILLVYMDGLLIAFFFAKLVKPSSKLPCGWVIWFSCWITEIYRVIFC